MSQDQELQSSCDTPVKVLIILMTSLKRMWQSSIAGLQGKTVLKSVLYNVAVRAPGLTVYLEKLES